MFMKKWLFTSLIGAILLVLAACGGEEASTTSSNERFYRIKGIGNG